MKLTIITINLNNVQGLQKTIESVICQTFNDYEYIVIDGGSNDGSFDLIKKYQDKISYWVSEPDKGIYDAMNKGIAQAHGEYLQFLNSGDWLVNESIIETIINDAPDCDLLYGNLIEVYPNGKTRVNYGTNGSNITFFTFYKGTVAHPSAFICRTLFTQYGLYDDQLKIASDWKFYLIAFGLNPSKIIYKNISVCYFDMKGVSNTQNELCKAEREKVLLNLIPQPILSDYKNNEDDLVRLEIIKRHRATLLANSFIQTALVLCSKAMSKINNAFASSLE
jgi:glycosyltransferase involved in cell wall biosynthesis